MPETLSQTGEFGLIHRLRKQVGQAASVVKGIGDDAAVVPFSSRKYLLLTADMLVEGTHFTRKTPAKAIGHKAVACSLSDIAAMGGAPKYAVISLGAPPTLETEFVTELYGGLQATAEEFGVALVGGDTVKSDRIIVNVAMTGEVAKRALVTRGGARKGDLIFVTGPLGRSLQSGWHLWFTPRLAQAHFLVRHFKPSAMIDISDGGAADLGHILEESRAGAILDERSLPLRNGAKLKDALYDGEDFELLFTLSPGKAARLQRLQKKGHFFRNIGEIVGRAQGLRLRAADGKLKRISLKGYTHF
jgi:thiamine-monophosphate kinase